MVMMPTSLCRSSSGFSLIEMLVVLTIVGLIAAAATATLGRPGGFATRSQTAALLLAIEKAQEAARVTGQVHQVDPASSLDGARIINALPSAPANVLLFYPDGSSSGGRVVLGRQTILSVEWLSGKVRHAT